MQAKSELTYRQALGLSVLVVLLVMLPRLISADFGLFDDGLMLRTASHLPETGLRTWDIDLVGRFRPVYWIYWWLLYSIFGANPFGFFVGNLAIAVLLVILLSKIVEGLKAPPLAAFLLNLFLVISPPFIENFYTLSKGEGLQLLGIAALLLLSLRIWKGEGDSKINFGLTLVITFVSFGIKETSIILLPIWIAWWLLLRLGFRDQVKVKSRQLTVLLGMVLAGGVLYLIIASLVVGGENAAGGMLAFFINPDWKQIGTTVLRWGRWSVQVFAYLLLVLPYLLIKSRRQPQKRLLLGMIVLWWLAWQALFLPWKFTTLYYMLPLALAAGVLLAWAVVELISDLSQPAERKSRVMHWVLIICLMAALSVPLLQSLTIGRIQVAVDAINNDYFSIVSDAIPPNAAVLVNIHDRNEYLIEIQNWFGQFFNRDDLRFPEYQTLTSLDDIIGDIDVVLVPVIRGQPAMIVRMGVIEKYQDRWNQQVDDLVETGVLVPGGPNLFTSFAYLYVDLPAIACKIVESLDACLDSDTVLNRGEFLYGWRTYYVTE